MKPFEIHAPKVRHEYRIEIAQIKNGYKHIYVYAWNRAQAVRLAEFVGLTVTSCNMTG